MELLTAPKKFKYTEQTLKVLSVIGGIAIVVAIGWVGVRGLSLFPNVGTFVANAVAGLQSVFKPAERITISTVDSQIVVNEPFTLSWDHTQKDSEGSYTLSYECRDNIFLARRVNGTQTTLFCNTDVPILATEKEIPLIVVGTVTSVEELPVSIAYTRNGAPVATLIGHATLLVQGEYFDTATSTDVLPTQSATTNASTTHPTTQTPQFTTVPVVTEPFSDPNGDPDLIVRVLGYGLVDKTTGVFTELGKIPHDLPNGKRAAIRFEIENSGTKETGSWKFEAELPTSPSYTYTSKSQQTLFPGDKIQYTIGFDRVKNADEDSYSITADSHNDVDESNEKNNTVDGTIQIDR